MTENNAAERRLSKLLVNILTVTIFLGLMATGIIYLLKGQPKAQGTAMEGFARQFQQSAETAHWQWQAQGRPQRIMLLHYNNQGKERARTPVMMEHTGRPFVAPNSKSCEKLWLNLLHVPTQVDGFKVIAEYFSNRDDAEQLGFCRYRLSSGPRFDFDLNNGMVQYSNAN